MLTNCHTLILRLLLHPGAEPPAGERDAYVYNVAPDSLPLSGEFKARETHRFAPPAGALARFPKLRWVKCHLVVDNLCHYGTLAKAEGALPPARKRGYAYRKGRDLIPLVEEFAREAGVALDAPTAHYLAHVLVEIAVDYAIYLDDRSVPLLLREAQGGMSAAQWHAYAEGIAALYGCAPDKVERARGAPARFYGPLHDIDYLYLDGRTRIILRKLRLDFGEGNTARARRLIQEGAERTRDYMDFVGAAVETLSDWDAWAGEAALASDSG